jgi:hypothetical protein
MAMLRRDNNLAVLRARLVRRGDAQAIIEFETQVGDGEARPIATWRVGDVASTREGTYREVEGMRTLPPNVARHILHGSQDLATHSAIWLELAAPSGFLPLLPWETMLSPILNRPILRLPYFTLRPRTASDTLDLVLCATSPLAKTGFDSGQVIIDIAHRIAESVSRKLTIEADVHVYDPQLAADYSLPRRDRKVDDSYDVVNPWLMWIRDSLAGRSVDVAHFACHGYLSAGQGALCFASSPTVNTDTQYSRFVGLGQLTSFLNQVGAWSFAVTGPPYNYSQSALRELGDSVARTSPRYVLVHDSDLDPGPPPYAELASAYQFLYRSSTSAKPPVARSLSWWVHPKLVEFADVDEPDDETLLTADGHSVVFEGETQQMIDDPATPAWVAANVRTIERVQANWLNQSTATGEPAVPLDVAAAALRNVAEFLNEQVRRERDERSES